MYTVSCGESDAAVNDFFEVQVHVKDSGNTYNLALFPFNFSLPLMQPRVRSRHNRSVTRSSIFHS